MTNWIKQINDEIDPLKFYREFLPNWSGSDKDLQLCSFDHGGKADVSPSLSLNSIQGSWHCFGCTKGGKHPFSYFAARETGDDPDKAVAILYKRFIGVTVPSDTIETHREELACRPRVIQRLATARGWLPETIALFQLGWDPESRRVTIPIETREGFYIGLQRHDSIRTAPADGGKRKPIVALPKARSGKLFPVSPRVNPFHGKQGTIWCVEGEPDAITATQEGLNAVTTTGGATQWLRLEDHQYELFKGKHVVICFDSDSTGQETAQKLAKKFLSFGVGSLKSIKVPSGNDIGEYCVDHAGTGRILQQVAELAKYLIPPKRKVGHSVSLSETSRADLVGELVETHALVNGKHHTPHVIPKKLELSCVGQQCTKCPCDLGKAEYVVDLDDSESFTWMITRDYAKTAKSELGVPRTCKMHVKVTQWQNLEELSLIPALTSSRADDKDGYAMRTAYYVGHGLEANQSYRMETMPIASPRTKESLLIVHKAENANDSIQNFKLKQTEVDLLKEIFCDSPSKTIKTIAHVLSRNHTKIYKRGDLHAAVDLALHSPLQFDFAGVRLPKGSIELLILGDTRCGKGQVAEGLSRVYDLGEVVSGENTSFMGMVGGLQKGTNDSWQLAWGAIPVNHGRAVIIDEFSSLDAVLPRLSRIRSEGVAEIAKGGITSKTRANTRLIWIANPKGGRAVSDFSSGIEAIQNLIGANEDIARFDLACVVQRGEVPVEYINRPDLNTIDSKYTPEVIQKIVRWVWSLSPDQIRFDSKAVEFILSQAVDLSDRYSPEIPLIQGENARFKIAKVAAAVAARCFSCNKDASLLGVGLKHAQFAVKFIKYLYDKPSMGYLTYSKLERQVALLRDTTKLRKWLDQFPDGMRHVLVDGMLSMAYFRHQDLQDWTNQDQIIAKKYSAILIQAHAVKMVPGRGYQKRPAFIEFLKENKNGRT